MDLWVPLAVPWAIFALLALLGPWLTPISIAGGELMADLGTIVPGAFRSDLSSVQTTIVGTPPVLEAIAAPDDTNYLADIDKVTHTGIGVFELGAMPGDFATMDTLFVQLRYGNEAPLTLNTWDTLTAQIMQSDGVTPLTNEVTVASAITESTPTNSAVVPLTNVQAGNETLWNGALLFLRISITKNMGGDDVDQNVYAGELTGTYTAGGVGPAESQAPIGLTLAAAPITAIEHQTSTSIPLTLDVAPVTDAPTPAGYPDIIGRASDLSGDVTSHTVPLPTVQAIAAGDLLLAQFTVDGAPTLQWPSGWVTLADQTHGGVASKTVCAYKVADGTEGASITVATDVAEGATYRTWHIDKDSWDQTTPPEIATAAGSSQGSNPPALDPSWGAEKTLFIAMHGHENWLTTVDGFPTNYSNGFTQGSNAAGGGSANVVQACAERLLEATSDDPDGFAMSSSRIWAALTVAIRPTGVVQPAEAQAPIGLTLDADPTTARPSDVTAPIDLTLDLDPAAAVEHQTSTSVPLTLDVDSTTVIEHDAAAALDLTLDVASTTAIEHEAQAPIGLTVDVDPVADAPTGEANAQAPIELTIVAAPVTAQPPQVAGPDSTVDINGWVIVGGAASHHAAQSDGNDATGSQSPTDPSGEELVVGFPATLGDPGIHTGHKITIRGFKTELLGSPTIEVTVKWGYGYVDEGTPGTVVQTDVYTLADVLGDHVSTLSEANAASIPSNRYDELQARVSAVMS